METKQRYEEEFKQDFGKTFRESMDDFKARLERLAELSERIEKFSKIKRERDKRRIKTIDEDIETTPMVVPVLERAFSDMRTSFQEGEEFVDGITEFFSEFSSELRRFITNRFLHFDMSFANEAVWEIASYMLKLHFHIFSRGPIPRHVLQEDFSPYSRQMFDQALENLIAVGEVVEGPADYHGKPENCLMVPSRREDSIIDKWLWSYRQMQNVDLTEEKKRNFVLAYGDYYTNEGSAVYAAVIAEILDEKNELLPASTIRGRFNKKFNGVSKSDSKITSVLKEMHRRGFVQKIEKKDEPVRWALVQDAWNDPAFTRLKHGDRKPKEEDGFLSDYWEVVGEEEQKGGKTENGQ